MANAPGTSRRIAAPKRRSCCSAVPRWWIAAQKSPHWTPALIWSEGSAATSSSNPAIPPPASSLPPRRSGNARSTCASVTRIFSCSRTRSRCCSMGSEGSRWMRGSRAKSRAILRRSFQRPRSRSSKYGRLTRASSWLFSIVDGRSLTAVIAHSFVASLLGCGALTLVIFMWFWCGVCGSGPVP